MCLIIIQTISLIIDFIIGIISSETEKDISFVYPIAFAYIDRIYQFCYSRFYFGFFSHRPHYPTSLHGNVQVESFNYNEWGTLPGKVTEISSDFLTDSQGNSFYKVKCQMERNYLMLKSGQKGILKKGMTVSAHFMITRRSLFDLLYQKIDDWANPKQYENNAMIAKF